MATFLGIAIGVDILVFNGNIVRILFFVAPAAIFFRFGAPRGKALQFLVRHVFVWPLLQQEGQIPLNVQTMCFCHFYNCVDYGAGSGTLGGIAEQPVLTTNHKGTDRVLGRIVGKTVSAVLQIDIQIRLPVKCIGKCLT